MPVHWMDISQLSFNSLLLLEQVQLSWLPGWLPETELALALSANPVVEWYFRRKCPKLNEWLNQVLTQADPAGCANLEKVRQAEIAVMQAMNDLLVYVIDPSIYDAQPFLEWSSQELSSLTDFAGKFVIDVGAGTGRLTLITAPAAEAVFAVEPVGNLRVFLKEKSKKLGLKNIFPVDGLITDIPFPDGFADITMGGHVFGETLEAEFRELERVTKPGGMIILCPGNSDADNDTHAYLVAHGFQWSRFEEPVDGMKRKYWKNTTPKGRAATAQGQADSV